eukprot:TRINITY_DN42001_c0_g1_i1.p1 TRINITY_DN42001_c0_g1~~TRINITY_DN42001_c0_g1_i1.p1  ORF type:complete len:256 (-),score=19.16 TRINITY_DN42001_c0_g1_i1:129-896(-)
MINTSGQTVMPGGIDPSTGMINTTGAPLMSGMTHHHHHGASSHGGRHRGRNFGYRLPPPPPSAQGRVIISVATQPDPAQLGAFKYAACLDANMGFLLQGNEHWLNQATLTYLMEELGTLLARQPVPAVAQQGFRNFRMFALGGVLWFILMMILGSASFGPDASVPPVLMPICGFGGLILIFVCTLTNLRQQHGELLQGFNNLQVTLQGFADDWTRRPEQQGLFQLTFRCGMTSMAYFELSPAAPTANPMQAGAYV